MTGRFGSATAAGSSRSFLLPQAVTIPIYGRLADLYGRKRVFFAGPGLFLFASTLCGLAAVLR
jgi:MFS family permease